MLVPPLTDNTDIPDLDANVTKHSGQFEILGYEHPFQPGFLEIEILSKENSPLLTINTGTRRFYVVQTTDPYTRTSVTAEYFSIVGLTSMETLLGLKFTLGGGTYKETPRAIGIWLEFTIFDERAGQNISRSWLLQPFPEAANDKRYNQ